MKYHMTENGPKKCVAKDGQCQYGESTEHYNNQKDANRAYEEEMTNQLIPKTQRREKVEWAPKQVENAVKFNDKNKND